MRAVILETLDAIGPLAADWEGLARRSPFATPAFCLSWLAAHREQVSPFVIALFENDRLVGVAPWAIARSPRGLRGVTGIGGPDIPYHDPVLPATPDPALDAIVGCMRRASRAWDRLSLCLRSGPGLALVERLRPLGWTMLERLPHTVIRFEADWEDYWEGRSKHFRNNLRRNQQKLSRLPHRYVSADAHNLESMLERLFTLHRDRWHAVRDWRPFYASVRAFAAHALSRGELNLYGLEIDGELAALDLWMRHEDRAYGLMRCFDPRYATLGVGFLLSEYLFAQLQRSGCREIDCGPGEADWKARFQTDVAWTVSLRLARFGSPPALAHLAWEDHLKPWLLRRGPALVAPYRMLKRAFVPAPGLEAQP
jgi:CelD/BcsL family acetyltransferase involved in cellulose biosynthesis